MLFLVLEDEPRAREHAEAAVALDPAVAPPEGAPGAAEALFRSASERLGGGRARLTIEALTPVEAGETARVRAALAPAPSALASTVRLRCDGVEAQSAPPAVELDVNPRGPVRCTAEALSPRGAALLAADRELPTGEGEPRERRPLPWIIGGSVAGAAAIAVVVGVLVARDDSAEFGGTTVVGW